MEPQEMIDMIIDGVAQCHETSKTNLLNLALVAPTWVYRSRYHLFLQGHVKLSIKSPQKARTFAMLLRNAHCTFNTATFKLMDVTLHFDQFESFPDDQLTLAEFLQNSVVTNSLSLTLDKPTSYRAAPQMQFPWIAFSSWSSLTTLTIIATLPSVQTIANIIIALPKLQTLTSNVHFVDPTVPPLCTRSSLPAIQNLNIGPRGYAVLGWLALFTQAGYSLRALVLDVGLESPSPLQDYALASANGVDYVKVILQDAKWAHDISRGIALLDAVFGVDIELQYPDYTATEEILSSLEIITRGLVSSTLMDLEISVPRLRLGLRDQLTILRALEAFVAAFSPVSPDSLAIDLKTLLFVPHILSRVSSQLLFRELDLHFTGGEYVFYSGGGDSDDEVAGVHGGMRDRGAACAKGRGYSDALNYGSEGEERQGWQHGIPNRHFDERVAETHKPEEYVPLGAEFNFTGHSSKERGAGIMGEILRDGRQIENLSISLKQGMPPNLKFIGLSELNVRHASLILEHGFPTVRVVSVGQSYWTAHPRPSGHRLLANSSEILTSMPQPRHSTTKAQARNASPSQDPVGNDATAKRRTTRVDRFGKHLSTRIGSTQRSAAPNH
ncbi:hypothetical protein DFP72DRAFT_1064529 [Ephemerocybe angulata]|uniref:Uncharacterized protein n=1 Tax=Ephemerocybe angulata TaxID=980116 RepID=A0A8H6MCG5_9AGAR|nr:hypothetical protein DFP72DRAFT_1064529 [Tulosesus angulatus]